MTETTLPGNLILGGLAYGVTSSHKNLPGLLFLLTKEVPSLRILCVDDDEDTRSLLEHLLGFADLEAISVQDTEAALRLIEKEQFSLYIIDGQLPGVSGLGLCEEIRKRDQRTPIIIFSGHAYASDREAGMLAGANVYLVKPDTSEIVPAIKRLLERARAANS